MASRLIHFTLRDGRSFLVEARETSLDTDAIFNFMDKHQIPYDQLWSFRPATDEEREEWQRKR